MRTVVTVLATVAILAIVGLGFMYSGAYDVGASTPHTGVGRWVFHTTMENSVRARAKNVATPQLAPERVTEGAVHYAAMCEGCHGAPGVDPNEVGRSLTPEPPDLEEAAGEWSEAELFWITKHGIKMTGMPAWGSVDGDDELWSVVAFVKALPDISAERYRALKAQSGGEHGHDAARDEAASSAGNHQAHPN